MMTQWMVYTCWLVKQCWNSFWGREAGNFKILPIVTYLISVLFKDLVKRARKILLITNFINMIIFLIIFATDHSLHIISYIHCIFLKSHHSMGTSLWIWGTKWRSCLICVMFLSTLVINFGERDDCSEFMNFS